MSTNDKGAQAANGGEVVGLKHRSCPSHCCPVHGCKYGHDDCPVVGGVVAPAHPNNNGCEACEADQLMRSTQASATPAAERLFREHPAVERQRAVESSVRAASEVDPAAKAAEPAPLCISERICATQGFCSRTGAPVEPMGNLGGDGGCPHPLPDASAHADDAAVDEFAALLKAKLAQARAKGRSGWRDPSWAAADINRQMHRHAAKRDPMDVAAYAMFLALRGEATTDATEQTEQYLPQGWLVQWERGAGWEFVEGKEKPDGILADCEQVFCRRARQAPDHDVRADGPLAHGWQISIAYGSDGYGAYAHMSEYPEEGAVLVARIPAESAARQHLAYMLDVHDDHDKPQELRCYVEGTWRKCLEEARELLKVGTDADQSGVARVDEDAAFEKWFEARRRKTWIEAGCHKDRGLEPSAAWSMGMRAEMRAGWNARAALCSTVASAADGANPGLDRWIEEAMRLVGCIADAEHCESKTVRRIHREALLEHLRAVVNLRNAGDQPHGEDYTKQTDMGRAALLWVLWHHQGERCPVGQPIRYALGMGAQDGLTISQVEEAERWAEVSKSATADFHRGTAPTEIEVGGDFSEIGRKMAAEVRQEILHGKPTSDRVEHLVVEWQASANKGVSWRRVDPPAGQSVEERVKYLMSLRTPSGARAYLVRALCILGSETVQGRKGAGGEEVALPHVVSPEAQAAIDSELEVRGWPCNPRNAARAGYEAARRVLGAAPAPAPSLDDREDGEASDGRGVPC